MEGDPIHEQAAAYAVDALGGMKKFQRQLRGGAQAPPPASEV